MYYHRIDALRSYAVMVVLFSHFFNPNITKHLFIGNAGVNLFFVISGFLITEILFKYKNSERTLGESLKFFYIRRSLRIFPIYYIYLLVCAVMYFILVRDALPWAFLYGINFYEQNNTAPKVFSHLWSLSVEEQFYLVWPLLILTLRQKFIPFLIIGLIIAAVLSRFMISGINHKLLTTSCLDAFGMGALFAYLKLYRPEKLKELLKLDLVWIVALIVYLAMIICNFYKITVLNEWFRLAIAVISFYLLGTCLYPKEPKNKLTRILLENKTAIYLGTISYGIYIYHILIGFIADPFVDNILLQFFGHSSGVVKYIYYNSYVIKFPLYTLITVALAALSFRYIEKPIAAFKNRITA